MPKYLKFCVVLLMLLFSACDGPKFDFFGLFKKKEVVMSVPVVTPSVTPTPMETMTVTPSPSPSPTPVASPSPSYTPSEERLPSISSLIKTLPKPEIDKAGNIVRSNIERSEKKENFSGELLAIEDLGASAFPELKKIFTDKREKWKRRYASAIALSRLRYEESKKLLLSGLNDDLSVIRVASILALKRFPHKDVIDGLHRVFKKDSGMIVRSSAANVLGEIADPRSIQILSAGLSDKRNFYKGRGLWIRKDIVNALGRFKSGGTVPLLVDILSRKEKDLFEPAVRSLENIVNPVSTSEPFLKSLDQKVKWWLSWWEANKDGYAG